MKLESILQKFGLSPKEAALYLAALELGSASVQKISEKAGIVRSTTYEILEELRTKGLVTTYLKKRVRHYSAEDPNQVLHFAESHVTQFKSALPELVALAGKSRLRPSVRFYQGKDGMKLILEEVLTEASELLSFGSVDHLFIELGDFYYGPDGFVARRVRKKIPVKALVADSPKARERQRLGPQELREVRLIPPTYPCQGMTFIWKNKITLFSFTTDYTAIVIEDRELANVQRALYLNLWDKLR